MKNGLILLTLFLLALPTAITGITTADSPPLYYKVTINIMGNENLTVALVNSSAYIYNISAQFTISHSTSFLVHNGTIVFLKSNNSFVVNNQGMITKYYGQIITNNTTLTVNFDIQSVKLPLSEYANITFILNNKGSLFVLVISPNAQILYTNTTINQTTTLKVPINSTVALGAFSGMPFKVNGSSRYLTALSFVAKEPETILNITFKPTTTTTTTTNTNSSTTTTTTNTTTSSSTINSIIQTTTSNVSTVATILPHSETATIASAATSANNTHVITISIIIIVVVLMITIYLILKRR